MTYPANTTIPPRESLDPAKQRWVIDALCRKHPTGSEWEIGSVREHAI